MKYVFAFLLFCQTSFIHTLEINESEHFRLFYEQQDSLIAKELTNVAEGIYSELEIDFNHTFTEKLQIKVFPNIADFHQSMKNENAPAWLVTKTNAETISIVSPLNPGTYHSKESILKIFKLNIIKTFIYQKIGIKNLPFWLVFGVAANKVNFITSVNLPQKIPSLAQLEEVDNIQFGEIGGFQCANSFVSFIERNYGWEKLFILLNDYNNFEQIMGLSKEGLYNQWCQSFYIKN